MIILICLQSRDRLITGCNQKLINLSLDKRLQQVKEPESKRIVNMLRKDPYLQLIIRSLLLELILKKKESQKFLQKIIWTKKNLQIWFMDISILSAYQEGSNRKVMENFKSRNSIRQQSFEFKAQNLTQSIQTRMKLEYWMQVNHISLYFRSRIKDFSRALLKICMQFTCGEDLTKLP